IHNSQQDNRTEEDVKALIVFLALTLLCTGFIFQQGDMGRYVRAQTTLKALAEECAAGAALYFDEEAYADGHMVFNQAEGQRYIAHMVGAASLGADVEAAGAISADVFFYDDRSGYGQNVGKYGVVYHPSVVVRLTAPAKDVFRLPFFSVTSLARTAMYELPY
ncbi:MAG: hypothetical protein LBT26_05970, partial [Clostridiales Family XIII bacterium]|nr:hypothetical protein [Clostridiales Family XIII bacterium]